MYVFPTRQATTTLVAALAIASLLSYATFLFDPGRAGHPIAYALLVTAEVIGMLQMLGIWATVLPSPPAFAPPDVLEIRRALPQLRKMPVRVVVFVPVAGEPIETIRATLIGARDIRLAHRTIVLDDGRSDEVKELAGSLGVEYIRRSTKEHWKAGNINHALTQVDCDFVAVFDSDQVAEPAFLEEALPYLLADPQLALVQTAQYYGNRESFIGGGSAEVQDIFYRHVQTGKNLYNSAFYVGTNGLFRREALDSVEGMYRHSHAEDIWTSIRLHEKGWKTLYVPHILAIGLGPETVDRYFRQQFRWARGGLEIFFKHNPLFQRTLTVDQKLQYLLVSMFYLTGFSTLIFFLLPLFYVYFGWKPLDIPEGALTWLTRCLPYYAMILFSSFHFLGRVPLWRTFVVAMTAFPSHIAACFSVITGLNLRWSVTGIIRRQTDYVTSVAPHLLLLLLSLGAIPLLLLYQQEPSVSFIVLLALLWNSAVLVSICKRAIPAFAHAPVRPSLLAASTPTPS